MSVSVQVVKNGFKGGGARLQSNVASAMRSGIDQLNHRSVRYTPVDTGELRANKTIDYPQPGDLTGKLTWNQEYAAYQEFGTVRGVPAKYFATKAARQIQKGYSASIIRAVEEAVG